MTASFSLFLEFCIQDGNIFESYGKWIEKTSEKKKSYEYWLKPIGGCVFCFGTWVYIITYLIFVFDKTAFIPSFIVLFLGCGVNYLFLSIFNKWAA